MSTEPGDLVVPEEPIHTLSDEKPVDVGAPAEETPEEEPAEAVEPEPTPEPKPRSGYAREKTRRLAAEARAEAAEAKLAKQAESPPQDDLKEPKIEDFNGDYLAHQNAMSAYWAAKGAVQGAERVMKPYIEQQRAADAAKAFKERVDDFTDRLQDDADKSGIGNIEDIARPLLDQVGAFPDAIRQMMFQTENPAPIVQYLAKNLDYAADLYEMNPAEQLFELGKLDAKLALPKARTKSNAPPPISGPKGGASPPRNMYQLAAKSEDISDYVKARQAKPKS